MKSGRTQDELDQLRQGKLLAEDLKELQEICKDNNLGEHTTEKLILIVTDFWREEPARMRYAELVTSINEKYEKRAKSILEQIDDFEQQIEVDLLHIEQITFEAQQRILREILEKCKSCVVDAHTDILPILRESNFIANEIHKKKGRKSIPPPVSDLTEQIINLLKIDGMQVNTYDDGIAYKVLESIFAFICNRDPEAPRFNQGPTSHV